MKVSIEIKFFLRPEIGQKVTFSYAVNGVTVLSIDKTFVASGAGTDAVLIGLSKNITINNLLANLQANNGIAGMVYSRVGDSVFADYDNAGNVAVYNLNGVTDYFSVYEHDAEVMGMQAFETKFISIEVIDTYVNARPLIEEFTQPSAPKLVWDGGEDLYQAFMPSNLKFNMAVQDAADAKFLHLLTGDEKRYLVKVKNHDDEGKVTLLWRGYLLPDLYSEPWKNGVPFIAFTAIDMIASLKGKTFDVWFYSQTFNLPVLFGFILAQTGLQQEMYVRPAFVNVSLGDNYRWRDINVSLAQFYDGKKRTDLYTILEKVLMAQGLQLTSFRGKWFFDGLTRRAEGNKDFVFIKPVAEVYHPDGVYKETVPLTYEYVAPAYAEELPFITAETPWKAVNLNFSTDSPKNLLPEEVVVKKHYATGFGYPGINTPTSFKSTFLDMWEKIGLEAVYSTVDEDSWSVRWRGANTNFTEYDIVTNYLECKAKPFAVQERDYELEIEVNVTLGLTSGDFEEKLKSGDYDNVLTFQLFNDGQEIASNRPSYEFMENYVFDKQSNGISGPNHVATFKLKREFNIGFPGQLSFRFLPPLGDINANGFNFFNIRADVLKINVVSEIEDLESVVAERDVQFTKELDIDLDITCTVDDSVGNSFGIAKRNGTQYLPIAMSPVLEFFDYQSFPPETKVQMSLSRWPITALMQDFIFRKDHQNSLFLTKADGTRLHYNSVYTQNLLGVPFMCGYNGYLPYEGNPDAKPNISKDYKVLPVPQPDDKLEIMLSVFAPENKNDRALWAMYGFPASTADSYLKTYARACHAVRPEVCFSIDAIALDLVWPMQLPIFRYNDVNRKFIPVRTELDITEGKTNMTMKEAKLINPNDISYE